MSFANATATPGETPQTITQVWWPDIDVATAREIIRISGTVTQPRLAEALQNAAWAVNRELRNWQPQQLISQPDELTDPRMVGLYLRAVYSYAKAELIERYRDYDATAAASASVGERRAQGTEDAAADARRNLRWAIADLLGRSRVTVELM